MVHCVKDKPEPLRDWGSPTSREMAVALLLVPVYLPISNLRKETEKNRNKVIFTAAYATALSKTSAIMHEKVKLFFCLSIANRHSLIEPRKHIQI